MTIQKKITTLLLCSLIVFLAACGTQDPGVPVTGETPLITSTPRLSPGLPPEAVLNAQEWLAMQLNVQPADVQIIQMEQAEWPDSCLGLGRLNESCAAVITPGWQVIFEVNGQSYEVRTDVTGSTIRLASPVETPSANTTLEDTNWNFVSFGSPEGDPTLIKAGEMTLLLADGQVGGFGGCNSFGGTYEVDGNNISIGQLTSTLRACADPQATEQEQRYLRALQSASHFELNGNQLVITYDNGEGFLIFETPLTTEPLPTVETRAG